MHCGHRIRHQCRCSSTFRVNLRLSQLVAHSRLILPLKTRIQTLPMVPILILWRHHGLLLPQSRRCLQQRALLLVPRAPSQPMHAAPLPPAPAPTASTPLPPLQTPLLPCKSGQPARAHPPQCTSEQRARILPSPPEARIGQRAPPHPPKPPCRSVPRALRLPHSCMSARRARAVYQQLLRCPNRPSRRNLQRTLRSPLPVLRWLRWLSKPTAAAPAAAQ